MIPARQVRLALGVRRLAPLALFASAMAVNGCQKADNEATGATAEAVAAASTESRAAPADAAPDSIVVYYFHGDSRCRTCMGIEQTIQKTVSERFAAETGSGKLVFREVNFDDPANAHFLKDFDLSSSSMVLVAKSGDKMVKWENCAKVWPLAHKYEELAAYTEKQIRSYLDLVQRT